MPIVFDDLTKPGTDEPMARCKIQIRLISNITERAYIPPSGISVTGRVHTESNAAGHWEYNLQPNSAMDPENTHYAVIEAPRNEQNTRFYRIVVPDGPGPYWVYDILVAEPDDAPVIVAGQPGADGVDGDDGAPGAQGPPGTSGGSYVHDQQVPASTWVITHSLGFYPNVTVVDTSDREVEGDLVQTSMNSMTITFSAAFGGKAYLS